MCIARPETAHEHYPSEVTKYVTDDVRNIYKKHYSPISTVHKQSYKKEIRTRNRQTLQLYIPQTRSISKQLQNNTALFR